MLLRHLKKYHPSARLAKNMSNCCPFGEPLHLICFKDWTAQMVARVVMSAMNLKYRYGDTHNVRLDTLASSKIMILQEVNEPVLNMAVSKGATLLGANDVSINDSVVWDYDYNGRIFGSMSDAIFVSTTTHTCVARFAKKSPVPVMCMRSRTHASIQALATIMAITEEFCSLGSVNVSWLGPPHPVLNSYLLLCPMLGANIKFKCCCKECPVSPLLLNASKNMIDATHTEVKECPERKDCLSDAMVIISGPSCKKKDKIKEFALTVEDIEKSTSYSWIYFHSGPRGQEVEDELFYHENSRTFCAFNNMHYVAAALMAYCMRGHTF